MGGDTSALRNAPSRRWFIASTAGAGLLPATRSHRDGPVPAAGSGPAAPAAPAAHARSLATRLIAAPQTAAGQSQALTPLYAGLAGRLSARCNIVCLGDSITEGQHAEGPPSTGFENRWLARFRDMLRASYPTQDFTGGGRGFIGAAETGELSFTWPAQLAGSPPTGSGGPKAMFVQLNGAGQSITFSLAGDYADIMWMGVPYGGTFAWAVDGGAATNVSTNDSSGIADGKLTHISLGVAGAHTLVLSWVSGACNIDGVIEYYGDYSQGIGVHDAGHYGWQASSWLSALNGGSAGGPAAAIAALSPSAVIITLGVNDQYEGVVPATFQSDLQTIIADLKARLQSPYPAFILNMLPPRYGQSGFTYPWSQYVTAAYNVAAADTSGPGRTSIVSVMDFTLGPIMPGADTDVYGFWQSGDLVHPANKGHQMIADCLAERFQRRPRLVASTRN